MHYSKSSELKWKQSGVNVDFTTVTDKFTESRVELVAGFFAAEI